MLFLRPTRGHVVPYRLEIICYIYLLSQTRLFVEVLRLENDLTSVIRHKLKHGRAQQAVSRQILY